MAVALLQDWASAHQHFDPTALKTQMAYLSDDLRNTFQAVGAAISAAKTEEEATKALNPTPTSSQHERPSALAGDLATPIGLNPREGRQR